MKNIMPKEMKDKWIAALRSGKYKQGKYNLYRAKDNAYCCLGVMQDAIDGKVEQNVYGDSFGLPTDKWCENHGIKFPTNGCSPMFELTQADLYKHRDDVKNSYEPEKIQTVEAFSLNDAFHFTFEEIADLVEEQVEGI